MSGFEIAVSRQALGDVGQIDHREHGEGPATHRHQGASDEQQAQRFIAPGVAQAFLLAFPVGFPADLLIIDDGFSGQLQPRDQQKRKKEERRPPQDRSLEPEPAGNQTGQGVAADVAQMVGGVHLGQDLGPLLDRKIDFDYLVDRRLEENEDEIPEKRERHVHRIGVTPQHGRHQQQAQDGPEHVGNHQGGADAQLVDEGTGDGADDDLADIAENQHQTGDHRILAFRSHQQNGEDA